MVICQTSNYYKPTVNRVMSLLARQEIGIDKERIEQEVKRLEEVNYDNKIVAVEYAELLKEIASNTVDGSMVLEWLMFGSWLSSNPVFMENYSDELDPRKFIEDNECQLVEFKFDNLMKVLAFNFMYKDIGLSVEDIEKGLSGLGVVATNKPEQLYKLIPDDIMSCVDKLRVEECDWHDLTNHVIRSYFANGSESNDFSYHDVCHNVFNEAMTIIIIGHILDIEKEVSKFRLVNVTETSFSMLMSKDYVKKLMEQQNILTVKVFGRTFDVGYETKIIKISSDKGDN